MQYSKCVKIPLAAAQLKDNFKPTAFLIYLDAYDSTNKVRLHYRISGILHEVDVLHSHGHIHEILQCGIFSEYIDT